MSAHPQILVANEPALYRDVLGSQLPRLRPGLTVRVVDPADLDDALAEMRPQLVICSEPTDSIRQHGIAALVLDPHGTNQAILDVDGQQQVLLNPRLTDLLAAVDAAVSSGPAATAVQRP
jgi:DNA-binding IclR family transcriptional regulator